MCSIGRVSILDETSFPHPRDGKFPNAHFRDNGKDVFPLATREPLLGLFVALCLTVNWVGSFRSTKRPQRNVIGVSCASMACGAMIPSRESGQHCASLYRLAKLLNALVSFHLGRRALSASFSMNAWMIPLNFAAAARSTG